MATQTYEAVIEVLDTLNRVEGKVDELLQQQQRLDEGYYIRLEIQPPPMLVGSHLQFKSTVSDLENQIEAKATELERRRPIAVGDACEVKATATIKSEATQICALVWATRGYDVAGTVTPAPLSVDRLKEALTASTSRPRVVVVWMEHGAERAAKQIMDAVPELTIIWI